MSIIKRIITLLLILLSSNFVISQTTKSNDNRPFLVNLNDPLVAHYSVSKDTSRMSISFYVNGYESKQKREKAKKERIDKLNKQKRPDYVRLPTFYINYIDVQKPEKLTTLDCDYKTLNEFNSSTSTQFLIYIIIKQDDGTYLKWSPVLLPEE
ncbi:hypothetical protein [Flavobacterium sp.]|uniref:hypothetical protein n=1 Tax=Flavobacterium sp. TaxID=239 RepID=UPI002C285765|nr:hypothetical protein [Flavobacterium sp.]HSD06599.1 hypothetical protein [Flavobacterium sp.]